MPEEGMVAMIYGRVETHNGRSALLPVGLVCEDEELLKELDDFNTLFCLVSSCFVRVRPGVDIVGTDRREHAEDH
jgi:hypothetical protein